MINKKFLTAFNFQYSSEPLSKRTRRACEECIVLRIALLKAEDKIEKLSKRCEKLSDTIKAIKNEAKKKEKESSYQTKLSHAFNVISILLVFCFTLNFKYFFGWPFLV